MLWICRVNFWFLNQIGKINKRITFFMAFLKSADECVKYSVPAKSLEMSHNKENLNQCKNTYLPQEGEILQATKYLCEICFSDSRMWSRLLPLQMRKGDSERERERGFFWKGDEQKRERERASSSRPASPLIIVSKESGKNPWDSRKCVPMGS